LHRSAHCSSPAVDYNASRQCLLDDAAINGVMMRILCADDDESIRMLLEVALGLDPEIHAEIVESGESALARAQEQWDVVLLDAMMPGLDGEETCRRLKADPRSAGIPVFFLTAITDDAERRRLAESGAAGFLPKPFDPFTLADALRSELAKLGG
jgi:CheY-like chemotaxis protein